MRISSPPLPPLTYSLRKILCENQDLVYKNKYKLDISVLEMVDDVVSDTKCSNKTALPYKFLQLHF